MTKLRTHVPAVKRIFDVAASTAALVILSPIVLLLGIAILIFDGPPVLFCQKRPGMGGRIFKVCKFRTMKTTRQAEESVMHDEERITGLGKFLRRTSLDELPELINVLKGEMSLVGPRPLLVQYLERYSPEQARRHEVLPGITGWAQVNGRNAIGWEEKFKLDVWYVDHWSFWLDIRILLMTVGKTFKGEGVSQPGRATMDEFMGNSESEKK